MIILSYFIFFKENPLTCLFSF